MPCDHDGQTVCPVFCFKSSRRGAGRHAIERPAWSTEAGGKGQQRRLFLASWPWRTAFWDKAARPLPGSLSLQDVTGNRQAEEPESTDPGSLVRATSLELPPDLFPGPTQFEFRWDCRHRQSHPWVNWFLQGGCHPWLTGLTADYPAAEASESAADRALSLTKACTKGLVAPWCFRNVMRLSSLRPGSGSSAPSSCCSDKVIEEVQQCIQVVRTRTKTLGKRSPSLFLSHDGSRVIIPGCLIEKKKKKKKPWNVGNDHMHCRNVICSFIQYLTNIYRVASMCSWR